MTQHQDGKEIVIVFDESTRSYSLGLLDEGSTRVGRVQPIRLTLLDLSDARSMAGILARTQGRDAREEVLYKTAEQGTDLGDETADPPGGEA